MDDRIVDSEGYGRQQKAEDDDKLFAGHYHVDRFVVGDGEGASVSDTPTPYFSTTNSSDLESSKAFLPRLW
jgi:hypothetical protein